MKKQNNSICPIGSHHVRSHKRKTKNGLTVVAAHCRQNLMGKEKFLFPSNLESLPDGAKRKSYSIRRSNKLASSIALGMSALFFIIACANTNTTNKKKNTPLTKSAHLDKKISVRCAPQESPSLYELGDLVCIKSELTINANEKLKIYYITTNKDSNDPYEHGYQELRRYKENKIIESFKLRRSDDAYWSEVPFVRVRKQAYLADLDGDGYMEFAILPFHPGSAIWMTARIFSLKEKISFWGTGRYQYEGDTYVKFNCPKCSKFNPQACDKCE